MPEARPDDDDDDAAADYRFAPARFTVLHLPGPGDCSQLGCPGAAMAKGLCKRHYEEAARQKTKGALCCVSGCRRRAFRVGMCRRCRDDLVARHRCRVDECPQEVFLQQLCLRHYALEYGRCTYDGCESMKIYCMRSMLCERHYAREHRKRKNEQRRDDVGGAATAAADDDGIVYKRRALLLREHPAPCPPLWS